MYMYVYVHVHVHILASKAGPVFEAPFTCTYMYVEEMREHELKSIKKESY